MIIFVYTHAQSEHSITFHLVCSLNIHAVFVHEHEFWHMDRENSMNLHPVPMNVHSWGGGGGGYPEGAPEELVKIPRYALLNTIY